MKQISLLLVFLFCGHLTISGQTTKLTGIVYDANGAVIVGAQVTAVASNKKSFQARTNNAGEYEMDLPFNKYDPSSRDFKIVTYEITAKSAYFQPCVISNFKIVPAYGGKMKLDFALDVGVVSDPVVVVRKPN